MALESHGAETVIVIRSPRSTVGDVGRIDRDGGVFDAAVGDDLVAAGDDVGVGAVVVDRHADAFVAGDRQAVIEKDHRAGLERRQQEKDDQRQADRQLGGGGGAAGRERGWRLCETGIRRLHR